MPSKRLAFFGVALLLTFFAHFRSVATAGVDGSKAPSSSPYRLAVWPGLNRSPDFRLLGPDRRLHSTAEFRGRIVMVLFGFTRCAEICPGELAKMAAVMEQLGSLSDRVQVLFISLDPHHDTPRVLQSYVEAFDKRFVGLTGSTAQVNRAAADFSVEYAHVPAGADYAVDHSAGVYVLDGAGHLRLIGASDSSISDFTHDLRALAQE